MKIIPHKSDPIKLSLPTIKPDNSQIGTSTATTKASPPHNQFNSAAIAQIQRKLAAETPKLITADV